MILSPWWQVEILTFNWFNQIEPSNSQRMEMQQRSWCCDWEGYLPSFNPNPIFDLPTYYTTCLLQIQKWICCDESFQCWWPNPSLSSHSSAWCAWWIFNHVGIVSAWSYHGPLHYWNFRRLITHTKWIRCSSEVHAGMGYDVPLHLLIPLLFMLLLIMDLVVQLNWRWKLRSMGRIAWPTTEEKLGRTWQRYRTNIGAFTVIGDNVETRSNQSKKSNAWWYYLSKSVGWLLLDTTRCSHAHDK